MENKILIGLGVLLMISGYVNALGQSGVICTNSCDCGWPLACHNGVCGENCYEHSECASGLMQCNNERGNSGPEFLGGYCDSSNKCTPAFIGWYDKSMICPECEYDMTACPEEHNGFFFDNLDDNRLHCGLDDDNGCYHLSIMGAPHAYYYNSNDRNLYLCSEYGDWFPVCQDGKVWDARKYPISTLDQTKDYIGNEDVCIPIQQFYAPESPLFLAGSSLIISSFFAYLLPKKQRRK